MALKLLILNQILGPLLRHGATTGGGALIADGIATGKEVQAVVGGIMAAISIATSFAEKRWR